MGTVSAMTVIGDRYELGACVGAGGMARVYAATDRLLERPVAVKILRHDLGDDAEVRRRFLREARTAAQFTHPNAVQVFDSGQDGGQPWIVMELIEGVNLCATLAAGPLPVDEALRIVDGVLAALHAAHRQGIVHRDVKPGNVLLQPDGTVKLADFGIAKSIEDAAGKLTSTGGIVGTPEYLSPEQVDGEPASPASDVYAAGVLLFELLTGRPPFKSDTAVTTALAHTTQPVPDVRAAAPGVPDHVAVAIERALAKDPYDRFADAGELRSALHGETAATVPLPPAAGGGRPRPRWTVAAALSAFALAGLLLLTGSGGDNQRPTADVDPPAQEAEASEPVPAAAEQPRRPAPAEASDPAKGQGKPAKAKEAKGRGEGKGNNGSRGKGKGKGKGRGRG